MAGPRTSQKSPSARTPRTPRPPRNTYDLQEVKNSALGRWIDIFTAPSLGGIDDSFLSGQHGPCPKCGGNDRFRLVDEREGAVICNQCLPRRGGDGFDVLKWLRGWTLPEAIAAVAEYLLVPPVTSSSSNSRRSTSPTARGAKRGSKKHRTNADPAEHLAFTDPPKFTPSYVALFTKNKPGITKESLLACGARQATYRKRHTVYALPIFGVELTAAQPVGWAMYEATGGKLPVFKDKKIVDWVKVKLTYGTQEGLVGPDVGRLAALGALEKNSQEGSEVTAPTSPTIRPIIWKTEGPSDAMALWSIIPEDHRAANLVITNSNGASQHLGDEFAHLLAVSGGPVVIIHDADRPGLFGARRQAAEIAEAMTSLYAAESGYTVERGNADHYKPFVYVVQLPYELSQDHGKDLRDWINEGHTFDELKCLISPGDPPGSPGSAERATPQAITRWEAEEQAALGGAARRYAALPGAGGGSSADATARVDEASPGTWSTNGDYSSFPSSSSFPPPPNSTPLPLEADDDPHRLARLFLEQANAAGRTVRYWRQQWYRWDGRAYREVPVDLIRGVIIRSIKAEFDRLNLEKIAAAASLGESDEPPYAQKVTIPLVANVLAVLSSFVALGPRVDLNRWVDDQTGAATARPLIALENGLLDIESVLTSDENAALSSVLLPHSPQWFSTSYLPYSFDQHATAPRWEKFITWAMNEDEELISLLQEWAGYLLLPDTSFQKFLVMEGEGSNGKSVFCAAMTALLGQENVTHLPLEKFGDQFALHKTVGKLANIIGDVGELEKAEEGFLKSFTSGDRMTFDRKFLPSVDAIPTARLMLAANNRPRFSDRSSGLWRRMMVVPFNATIAEDSKVRHMDKPDFWLAAGELPGMLNWALLGLHRLRTQDRFTIPQVSAAALADYRLDSNPAASFLEDHYEENPDQFVVMSDIYATYKKWCYDNGNHPMSSRNFGKEVKRAFPKSETVKKGPRGDRFWAYEGIATSAPLF